MKVLEKMIYVSGVISVGFMVWSATATAAMTKTEKLNKSTTVVAWYEGKGSWTLRPRYEKCKQIKSPSAAGRCYKHRQGYRWHKARISRLTPKPVWGPWAFPDACLREISRRETAGTYSPTIWNYEGSGAYGIGQALPATKMAPWGADYMTNPWTQLRWMIDYVNGRYGGSCAALAYHNAHGSY